MIDNNNDLVVARGSLTLYTSVYLIFLSLVLI